MTIKEKIIAGVVAIVIALMLATVLYIRHLRVTNEQLSTTITQQGVLITSLKNSNESLSASITKQNAAISSSHDALVKGEQSLSEAKESVKVVEKKVIEYRDRIISDPTPETCTDAIQYILDARKDLK